MTRAFCEWSDSGIATLRDRVGVLVIVDVLSFCTAVDIAVGRGAEVIPFPLRDPEAARAAAAAAGAELALPRRAAGGQYSLSPPSLARIPPGTRLLLPSPNGSRLAAGAGPATALAGCLRNAAAVADAARRIAGNRPVGVVPAGERWVDGTLRPAIEDLLGAGAILDRLGLPLDAEAATARDAFRAAGGDLAGRIRGSVSGRELIDGGFPGDVETALELDASGVAPVLVDGAFRSHPTAVPDRRQMGDDRRPARPERQP